MPQFKEALLLPALLRRPIDSMNAEMRIEIAKLQIFRPTPRESANELHTILPDCLQSFIEI